MRMSTPDGRSHEVRLLAKGTDRRKQGIGDTLVIRP